jgi:ATP-binding cassette, subfamily B, bacterial
VVKSPASASKMRRAGPAPTSLPASYRFATVRMADQILVMEGGRIAEAGTHSELVARAGRYAELFEMQAGRYR